MGVPSLPRHSACSFGGVGFAPAFPAAGEHCTRGCARGGGRRCAAAATCRWLPHRSRCQGAPVGWVGAGGRKGARDAHQPDASTTQAQPPTQAHPHRPDTSVPLSKITHPLPLTSAHTRTHQPVPNSPGRQSPPPARKALPCPTLLNIPNTLNPLHSPTSPHIPTKLSPSHLVNPQ
jgi:hypothetical protein